MRVSVVWEKREGVCCLCGLPKPVLVPTMMIGTGVQEGHPSCLECTFSEREDIYDVDIPAPDMRPGPPDHRVKRTTRRHEEEVAVRLGGRRQPGSGALPGFKGDVRVRGKLRVELKDSFSRQFTVTRDILDKVRGECDRAEKPALIVSFRDRHTHVLEESWVLIPTYDWEELLHASNDR